MVRRLGVAMATVAGLALVVAMVVTTRTFVFEYFHGDRSLIHELLRASQGQARR